MGAGRSDAGPGHKCIDGRRRALDRNLDPAVAQVPCPTGQPEAPGLPLGAGSVEDPLDEPGNEDVAPNHVLHDVGT